MQLRIVASRHSAFYSPLIACIGAGFLEKEGFDPSYGVLEKGQRSQDLIRDGAADVMQSAVSSNWNPLERGESPLPVHFAQINQRDGFFLVANQPLALAGRLPQAGIVFDKLRDEELKAARALLDRVSEGKAYISPPTTTSADSPIADGGTSGGDDLESFSSL